MFLEKFQKVLPIFAILAISALGYSSIIVPVINPYLAVPPMIALLAVSMLHRSKPQDNNLPTLHHGILTLAKKRRYGVKSRGHGGWKAPMTTAAMSAGRRTAPGVFERQEEPNVRGSAFRSRNMQLVYPTMQKGSLLLASGELSPTCAGGYLSEARSLDKLARRRSEAYRSSRSKNLS